MPLLSKRGTFKRAKRYRSSVATRRANRVNALRKNPIYRRSSQRGLGFHVHNYKRWGASDLWTVSGDGLTSFWSRALTFSLSGVTEHSELTQLYDQYKIMAVVVKVHLLNNPDAFYQLSAASGASVNGANFYPKLWYYRDYDDNTAPPDRTTLKQIGKAKCFTLRPNKTYSFKIKPAVLNLMSGTTTAPIWPNRLDCTNSTQTHYGMKFVLDYEQQPPPTGQDVKVMFETLYYIKMFNSR